MFAPVLRGAFLLWCFNSGEVEQLQIFHMRYRLFYLAFCSILWWGVGCQVIESAPQPFPTPLLLFPTPTATETVVLETAVSPAPPTLLPTPSPVLTVTNGISRTIGLSAQGRPMLSYQFNDGPNWVVFIGGIHGGYEWNTILLAYEVIDYFTAHPELIPDSVTLLVIPSANPDGQYVVTNQDGRFDPATILTDTVPGRFNSNGVDLNRNWDCQWSAQGQWRDQVVSGGERPFSEPETLILRDYLLGKRPKLVIFWHSAADGVFASGCPDVYQPSLTLATTYAQAADYPVYERFTTYPVTGDATDWLATQGIPAFAVELKNHADPDWPQNLAGITAVLSQISSENP